MAIQKKIKSPPWRFKKKLNRHGGYLKAPNI
jgi:hypothetical protein